MKLACLLIAALAVLLGGCESVYAPRPMGGEPVVLDDSWNGTWLVDDGALTTVVRDAQQGLLQVAWVEVGAQGAGVADGREPEVPIPHISLSAAHGRRNHRERRNIIRRLAGEVAAGEKGQHVGPVRAFVELRGR